MIRRLDARMRVALLGVAAFGAAATLAGAFWSGRAALSVAIGAAIATTNLYVMAQIVAGMIGPSEPAKPASPNEPALAPRARSGSGIWGMLAFVTMNVLIGGLWLLMTKGLVAPMGLLAGYGSLPIGIAIGSLVSDKTTREPSV